MFAASFTVAPASMAVGNSSAEATVTASLAFATRPSPDCWHSAPFSAFCASAASHSFRRSAAASAPSSDEGPSACGSSAEMPKVPSAGPADRSLSVGRAFSAGCAPSAATASFVLSISLGFLLRLRLGFCGNYRIKDRLIRWKTTSRLITHVCPNKQWRTGMRENGERERAVEDDPHGFWHRFGRATRRHNKDAICRAFRPVGVKLEHGALDDFAHHSIRFGDIPEISSWQKRFLDSQGTKHAPKVTIVGAPLATPDARTTAAKNAARRIPSKASMPTSPQPPRRKSERLKHYSKKDLNSKGSDLGIRPNHTQRLFSRQISSKRWHLQKAEAHTLLKNLE